MSHDVFVSYASEDKAVADAVCAKLEALGIRCWIAPRDVLPGTDYGEGIVTAILNGRLMVLVLSRHSNSSEHVKNEVERAVSAGKPVIPLRVEGVMPAGSLALHLSRRHWLDALTPPLEKHLKKLGETVQALLSVEKDTAETDTGAADERVAPKQAGRQWDFRVVLGKLYAASTRRLTWLLAPAIVLLGLGFAYTIRQSRDTPSGTVESPSAETAQEQGRAATEPARETRTGEGSYRPGDTFSDCSTCPEMVVIPAGRFTMGSPEGEQDPRATPQHSVTIPRDFGLGKHEVTRAEFAVFAQEAGLSWPEPLFLQTDRHPAVSVSWHDANRYVEWLSRKTGHAYRLPSESEWEYAARAGTTTSRYWGESPADACRHANVNDSSHECLDGYENTAPVGTFRPNRFGLHDTLGNVKEWVEDCRNDSYSGAPDDGEAWTTGDCTFRILRGGSFGSRPAWYVGSAVRSWNQSTAWSSHWGFRVAMTLP